MTSVPTVSVLLPFYQAASTLKAALQSVRRQTLASWECVLLDDGSTDAGPDLARGAVAADERFRLVSRPHSGLVEALNTGIEHCLAPLVARMDADDLMHGQRLQRQCEALETAPEIAAIGCHVRLFPRRGLSDGMRDYERWLGSVDSSRAVRRDAFIESPLAHPTLIVRRQVLSRFGYRDRGWPEDYDLLLRLLGAGHEVGVVPRRLLSWRDSPERLTRTGDAYRLERITACKAHHLAATFLAGADSYLLWGYGSTGRGLARALRAHGKRPAAIIELHPRRLGQRIGGAPVVPHEEIPRLPRLPLLASVAGAEPRRQIREYLASIGRVEDRDFVCTA